MGIVLSAQQMLMEAQGQETMEYGAKRQEVLRILERRILHHLRTMVTHREWVRVLVRVPRNGTSFVQRHNLVDFTNNTSDIFVEIHTDRVSHILLRHMEEKLKKLRMTCIC